MANNKSNNNSGAGRSGTGSAGGNQTKSQKRRERRRRNGGQGGGGAVAAVNAGYIAQGPAIVGGSRGAVRFSNTEFIADVSAPTPGATGPVLTLNLNPTNPSAFPWLSRIAAGYELYRFRRLVVRYTPSCSTQTAGIVVGAFDYDASDAPPTNKQALSSYEGAVRGNVWNKLSCAVKPMAGWYYTGTVGSSVSNPANTDLKMYDLGKFYLGVYNQNSAGAVGEISVDYEVEFAKPDSGSLPGLSQRLVATGTTLADIAAGTVSTGNQVFGLSSTGSGQLTMTASTAGEFLLDFLISFLATSGVAPIASILQYDPGAGGSIPITSLDSMTGGYTNASTANYFIGLYACAVLAGTTIVIQLNGAVTSATISRLRVASYRKALA